MQLSADDVRRLSYADFVGLTGQQNTPPGGRPTIEWWVKMACISASSRVLDLACSTAFSSRTVMKLTGCSAKGVDISETAITMAMQTAAREGFVAKAEYRVGDAARLPFADDEFTHVLAGCTFGFIQQRRDALRECARVLNGNGRLCISTFYYKERPPEALLDDVARVVGFRPDAAWTLEWWNEFFGQQFVADIAETHDLPVASDDALADLARITIYDKAEVLRQQSAEVKNACYEKFLGIRKVLNEHRRYQRYCLSTWGRS